MEQFTFKIGEKSQVTEGQEFGKPHKGLCVPRETQDKLVLELAEVFLNPAFSDLLWNIIFSGTWYV